MDADVAPCPECRQPIAPEARVCPYCRRSVLADVAVQSALGDHDSVLPPRTKAWLERNGFASDLNHCYATIRVR